MAIESRLLRDSDSGSDFTDRNLWLHREANPRSYSSGYEALEVLLRAGIVSMSNVSEDESGTLSFDIPKACSLCLREDGTPWDYLVSGVITSGPLRGDAESALMFDTITKSKPPKMLEFPRWVIGDDVLVILSQVDCVHFFPSTGQQFRKVLGTSLFGVEPDYLDLAEIRKVFDTNWQWNPVDSENGVQACSGYHYGFDEETGEQVLDWSVRIGFSVDLGPTTQELVDLEDLQELQADAPLKYGVYGWGWRAYLYQHDPNTSFPDPAYDLARALGGKVVPVRPIVKREPFMPQFDHVDEIISCLTGTDAVLSWSEDQGREGWEQAFQEGRVRVCGVNASTTTTVWLEIIHDRGYRLLGNRANDHTGEILVAGNGWLISLVEDSGKANEATWKVAHAIQDLIGGETLYTGDEESQP